MDRTIIEQYAAGADVPGRAIRGLTKKDLNTLPKGAQGAWTIQQIVVHLMDSHVIASERMKRIIAEDHPTIQAYDETKFSENLHYDKLDAAMACEVFRLNQLLTAELLRNLPDEAFNRTGLHTETGVITLAKMIPSYAAHVDHHMKFIREKRKLLGKPLEW